MRKKIGQLVVGLGLGLGMGILTALAAGTTQGVYLNIATGSNEVVLSWSSAATNFVLQSSTNLLPGSWNEVPNLPVITNGEYRVTNSLSDPQRFYRLSTFNMIPPGTANTSSTTATSGKNP